MSRLDELSIADRHREVAAHFSALVDGVTEWDAPTPVVEWQARDVVRHLVEWLPGLLGSQGLSYAWPEFASADQDPATAWRQLADSTQALLDDPTASGEELDTQMFGKARVDTIIDRFYVADVFMHAWDLARASSQDDTLDPEFAQGLLSGLESIEEQIRASGQFGTRQPVADDAPVHDKLMAFAGRDPQWSAN